MVKRLTGQMVADFIFQMIYSEARLLLQQPKLSVKQIADSLNFSDQSAFGKFFKRKSGVSPRQFRKKMAIF
ncbi:helix-turn-helix domain-containing protein [Pontibacter amylolyticus]|uniref:helix-turn-helix domain-containing protein n=1 Tax=Pontibacter amylolyticus TaxID=1424080 RepID=UPI0035713EE4